MSAAPLLDVRGLKCVYRTRGLPLISPASQINAVDEVNLTIVRGEILGLVGESGCGKSTLAKALMGVGRFEAQRMAFNEADINMPLRRRPRQLFQRIQYVFQDPMGALDPRKPVLFQVAEPLHIHKRNAGGWADVKARETLSSVSLGPEIDHKFPHELSGGQRQRVVIARALVLEPELLICDEPVSALDMSIQAQIVNLLLSLREERGISILFISHDLGLVRYLCDRVAVMYLGRICEIAGSDALVNKPRHPYTRALVSAIPPAHPSLRKPYCALSGEPPQPGAPPQGCRFHPRCTLAQDVCSETAPRLETLGNTPHAVACHLVGDGTVPA